MQAANPRSKRNWSYPGRFRIGKFKQTEFDATDGWIGIGQQMVC